MSAAPSLIPDIPNPRPNVPSTAQGHSPPGQIEEDPNDLLTSSNPYEYLASEAFHKTFFCSRTQSRVSYVDCGDKKGPLLFYVLPSGCSRWVAVFLDGYARAKGVRLVAPDRPGQGCTPRVQLESRIETSTSQTLSLMEHLKVGGKRMSFLTHSAGIYFLLPVLLHLLRSPSPILPVMSGGVFLSSPWIPASVSGNRLFPFIPASVATKGHFFIPKFVGSVNWLSSVTDGMGDGMKNILAISGINMGSPAVETEISARKKEKVRRKEREASVRECPTADIHPPFESQSDAHLTSPRVREWIAANGKKLSPDLGLDLVFAYMSEEGFWGMSQEHALCLGGGNPEGEKGLVKALENGWEDVGSLWKARVDAEGERSAEKLLTVVNYWASADGMIPAKGRDWLDTLLTHTAGIAYERHELGSGAGHDTTISTREVVEGILDWVKLHG